MRHVSAYEGVIQVITHNISVDSPNSSGTSTSSFPSLQEQYKLLQQLRHELHLRYRPILQQGAGPIRVMARMVAELEQKCREQNISEEVIHSGIVNRTIGDVNLRKVVECVGEPEGPDDYRMLAEELGVALPNENINGYTAPGETYLWLRNQMTECERLILAQGFDIRIYDILGIGNPVLRSWLAEEMQSWGISVGTGQVYLGLGAMDGIDKTLRGLRQLYREQGISQLAVLFPAPGFNVPELQAISYGYRLHRVQTLPENSFKITATQLDQALTEAPDIRLVYITVTNNPTTFAYTADELNKIHAVIEQHRQAGHDVTLLADLAYIGTGKPEEDQARMATFTPESATRHTIFISSLSKTHTLTGDRFGWVAVGDLALAPKITPGWSNSMASMPAEWQLRFMAYIRLMRSRPWLSDKLRRFYRLRRNGFIKQLQCIDAEQHLFEQIYIDDDATVYNWSKLRQGEDAFSLFEKTGIAGVPGSGFSYTDEYVRFSIGVIPITE
jgi:aspartate/methionine/tyrosine aminotransferase